MTEAFIAEDGWFGKILRFSGDPPRDFIVVIPDGWDPVEDFIRLNTRPLRKRVNETLESKEIEALTGHQTYPVPEPEIRRHEPKTMTLYRHELRLTPESEAAFGGNGVWFIYIASLDPKYISSVVGFLNENKQFRKWAGWN